jgi:hypothetical protein
MWQGDGVGYAWQPGYWTAVQTSWIWVPPHYAWTPCGVLFVPGYWDYTLPRRGLLFAPVAFPATVYVQPAFVYTPVVVVQQTVLVQHLFCRPSYGHYYFGDYYDPGFRRSGFVAWFEFGNVGFGGGGFGGGGIVAGGGGGGFRRHGGFDPIYAQAAAVGRRDDPMWERRVRTSYERRVADPGLRPAQTYLAARREMALRPASAREASLVAPLAQVAASNPMNLRLERVDAQRREAIDRRAEALRTFQSRRIDQETRLAAVRAEAVRSRPQAAFSPVAQPARLAASPIAAPMPTPTPTSRPTPGAAAQAMIAARDERLRAYQEQVQRAQAERTERASAAIAGRSAPSPMPLQPRMQPQATPIPRRESTPGAAAQAMIAARDERLRAYQEQMRRAQAERASPSAAAGRTTAIQPQIQPRIQPQAAPTPRPGPTPGAAAQTAASARAERLKAYQERVEKAKSERPARPR